MCFLHSSILGTLLLNLFTVNSFRTSSLHAISARERVSSYPTSTSVASMSSGEQSGRAHFIQSSLTAFLGLTLGSVGAPPAWADLDTDIEDGVSLLDAMRMMDMDAPPGEDVLTASDDTLPNRTPFEMQYELFKRGMELEAESKYEAAERQWTEVIDNFNSPNFRTDKSNKYILARAYSNRGNTRLTLQRTTEAILDYSASIELVPERGEFWLNRGVAYEDMADRNVLSTNNKETVRSFYESALADYDHAVVLDPQDPQVYISRGDANSLLGQERKALDNYRRAVSLSPTTPEYRSKVALAEIQCGNLEKGAYLIGELLKRYPEYPDVLLAGAAVAFEAGEIDISRDMYNEAVNLDPRLMDDAFIWLILRWPTQPLAMVDTMRRAGKLARGAISGNMMVDGGLDLFTTMPRQTI